MNSVETWYYLQDSVSVGPLPRAAIESMVRSGVVRPETLVWPGYGEWIAASSSSLGPVFFGGGTPVPDESQGWRAALPKDRRVLIGIIAVLLIGGAYSAYRDSQQGQGGQGGGNQTAGASIVFQGCQRIAFNVVQCGFQNNGSARKEVCMDVVLMCADGRHVAKGCSGPLQPGETATRRVENFKPDIQMNVPCSGMTFENWRT